MVDMTSTFPLPMAIHVVDPPSILDPSWFVRPVRGKRRVADFAELEDAGDGSSPVLLPRPPRLLTRGIRNESVLVRAS